MWGQTKPSVCAARFWSAGGVSCARVERSEESGRLSAWGGGLPCQPLHSSTEDHEVQYCCLSLHSFNEAGKWLKILLLLISRGSHLSAVIWTCTLRCQHTVTSLLRVLTGVTKYLSVHTHHWCCRWNRLKTSNHSEAKQCFSTWCYSLKAHWVPGWKAVLHPKHHPATMSQGPGVHLYITAARWKIKAMWVCKNKIFREC